MASHPATGDRVIRIVVLDRHPAFRFGVDAFLKAEPDLEPIGCAADTRDLWSLLKRLDPDIVLVDHQPDRPDRLALCLRIKARLRARIIRCAGDPEPDLIVSAALTGVDAIVEKADDPRALLATIRTVAAGEPARPHLTARLQAAAAARRAPGDRAVFAMRPAGTAPADIAAVAGFPAAEHDARLATIIAALCARDADESPISRFTRAAA
jgi:DNA-binding NarL/FixJ family response regulator